MRLATVALACCAWSCVCEGDLARRCAVDGNRCRRLASSRDPVVVAAINAGGYLCRALLLLTNAEGLKSTHLDVAYHDAVDEVCGYHERDALRIEPHAPSSELVFASVQHNGLGNQLFQYAVGRLLARALGARFVARRIEDFEGPMTTKLPPHSGQSFEDFEEIFALDSRAAAQFERERCARLVPTRGEYAANGTILLAQRPADTRRVRLSVALAAIAHRGTQLKCVRAIGYFQDYALLRGFRQPLASRWLRPRADLELTETASFEDVVVHVRLCAGPVHFYKYYSWGNYFEPVLAQLDLGAGALKIITGCDASKAGVVRDLVEKAGAIIVKPFFTKAGPQPTVAERQRRPRSAAADFLYMARARRLIVTESTYSWWAAFLNLGAAEIHAPASGVVPVPYREANYVFHDITAKSYWGRFDSHRNKLVFENVSGTFTRSGEPHSQRTAYKLQGAPESAADHEQPHAKSHHAPSLKAHRQGGARHHHPSQGGGAGGG